VAAVGALAFASSASPALERPFDVSVHRVTRAELGASYHAGCPVGPSQLRLLELAYVGFDGRSRRGWLVVNASVVGAVEKVFATLYADRFPIRHMLPVAAYGGSDNRSMAADNTSGFNCRLAVTTGHKVWSVHAYGEAIDVNPVENPYLLAGVVYPPGGGVYSDRRDVRPGMAVYGGTLVDAFEAVGWQWGGRWTASPDYQHFSSTGG
jgi:hypothetical protein